MSQFEAPPVAVVQADVRRALDEDIGSGDATAALLPDVADTAYLLCKEPAVVCGRPWFDLCHRLLDSAVDIRWHVAEGDRVAAGTLLATLDGRARALVTAERTSLNFMQTLSATATVTAAHVDAVAGTRTKILDTRKTIPGLRVAQKYAVRVGGGSNHRFGLDDAILIKDNHIAVCGGVGEAVRRARAAAGHLMKVEVEVDGLDQLDEALAERPDVIMLDNFTPPMLREAVARTGGRARLEASGGIDLTTVRGVAETGVDVISVGALTHSAPSLDIGLDAIPA